MSGPPPTYYVGGIQVARSLDLITDDVVCSVFYQMAEFVNDDYVRQALQISISHNGALELPPVSVVSNPNEQDRTRAATITGGPLQVTIPLSSGNPDIALDTRDISICTAIMANLYLIGDDVLRASVQNGANAGLERIALVFAGDVAQYQALGVSLSVEVGSIQVNWNYLPGGSEVLVERWEVDQPTTQLIATLDRSSTSFNDTTVSSSKIYVYDVKVLGKGVVVAVGYSERVAAL